MRFPSLGAIVVAALAAASPAPAQDRCSALSVAGLRPGMSVEEVHAAVHVEAAESEILLPDGSRGDVESYALPEGVLRVEYDGPLGRPETRVALVWQPMRQTLDAVTTLLNRAGEPASGRDALVRGLEHAPAVWIEPRCDRVLTYYRRPEYWIGEEPSTVLRVE